MSESQANSNTTEGFGVLGFEDASIPQLQHGETIYSWCSRFHQLNIGSSARSTSRTLFGHPKAALWHDIPGHMQEFQRRIQGALGDSKSLLRARTLFGFHVSFLPTELEENLLTNLIEGDGTKARKQLGYEHINRVMINALKWCPECVDQQLSQIGFSWWLMEHQHPTAFVCHTHGVWLQTSQVRLNRGACTELHTPQMRREQVPSIRRDPGREIRDQMTRLSQWRVSLAEQTDLRFDDEALRFCYLLKAGKLGHLTLDGSIRLHGIRQLFVNRYAHLIEILGQDFFGDLNSANGGFLSYMFRQLPSRRHPLKHYFLMNLLFESSKEFLEMYKYVLDVRRSSTNVDLKTVLSEGQNRLLKLVVVDGQTVGRAADEVGVSISSAAKFLLKNGVNERSRRPHIVGTSKERELIQLLLKGRSRMEIAKALELRPAFIKDYLATRPKLKNLWTEAHWNNQLQLHRTQLSDMLHKHSELPVKSIRRIPGNGFQWLYVNDREWLKEILPAIWKR